MLAARRRTARNYTSPSPLRRYRSEPKSLALLVDVVLARYGILPLNPEQKPEPARKQPVPRRGGQALLFPVG